MQLLRRVYTWLPVNGVRNPVFLVGCGRSGTTILGNILSHHPRIAYLNEPRHLWSAAYPQTDIWSTGAKTGTGRLYLTAADVSEARSKVLGRLFDLERKRQRGDILVEKLPINSFRLDFILAMFPEARFLHLHRNGIEVAHSIRRETEAGKWYGANDYKLDQLLAYASSHYGSAALPECDTAYRKGLLEWRMSVASIVAFLERQPAEMYYEISYNCLLEDPAQSVTDIFRFLGAADDSQVIAHAAKVLERRSPRLNDQELSDVDAAIGGPLLSHSMDGKSGLVGRTDTLY